MEKQGWTHISEINSFLQTFGIIYPLCFSEP